MDIQEEILKLKEKKDAIILAHYYQRPEIQEIADAIGDSYYLSKLAKDCPNKVIVFCGVRFMAESAKILSPEKTIILPVQEAGCPMADIVERQQIINLKKEHPNAAVVCYINSTAQVKAESDVTVTSSNAFKIIKNLEQEEIIFLPDQNLGSYIAEQIPEKRFILWKGFCITHKRIQKSNIIFIKKKKPRAKVLVHPECEKDVRNFADFIGSTKEMIDYATSSKEKDFIIVTEQGILHALQKKNPDKNFYIPDSTMICTNMKKIRLEDVYKGLFNMNSIIEVEEKIRQKAFQSLINMHRYAKSYGL
ncbi:quinolinate synthase NadA [Garciella nitratireducens]|uniref:Quinolinate synthase n=1 Tax=Garciella nitratireducens DSM 15102 TaxID=1121911 RepID=A0A1T4M6Y4_9FIRM|nr:quinolinate synthase NadA [Garciella nitratireducens]SJZ62780.1 quinolinate synthetase [Garciella nitratireducens DSM 15102]